MPVLLSGTAARSLSGMGTAREYDTLLTERLNSILMNPIVVPDGKRRWDCLSLGEVMLRLDPGEGRTQTTRSFQVWEGGGEYNVARGLRRCFGLRTAVATALADNPVGRLVEDCILQGGVDTSLLHWMPFDGVGRVVRNGLNFTERGFGLRAATGCSDRGHTAVSQLKPGDFDWESILRAAADGDRGGSIQAGFLLRSLNRLPRWLRRRWMRRGVMVHRFPTI